MLNQQRDFKVKIGIFQRARFRCCHTSSEVGHFLQLFISMLRIFFFFFFAGTIFADRKMNK